MEFEILGDADPSPETVRRWGYNENVYLIEQDEDLILGDARYVPVLLELAADPACPKRGYALDIVRAYTHFLLTGRHREQADPIASMAEQTAGSPDPHIREWAAGFLRGLAELGRT